MSTSSICDSQVNGCQFPPSPVRNAQVTLSQLSPACTRAFSVTYTGSSKPMNPWCITGQKTANVKPHKKPHTIVSLQALLIGSMKRGVPRDVFSATAFFSELGTRLGVIAFIKLS